MSLFGCTQPQFMVANLSLLDIIGKEYGKTDVSNNIIISDKHNRYKVVENTFINRHFHFVVDIRSLEIEEEQLTKLHDFKLLSLAAAFQKIGAIAQREKVLAESNRRQKALHDKLETTISCRSFPEEQKIEPSVSVKKHIPKKSKSTSLVAPAAPGTYHDIKRNSLTNEMKLDIENYIVKQHPQTDFRWEEWGVFVILSKREERFYLYENVLMRIAH